MPPQPRPSVPSSEEPAGQRWLAAISPDPKSPQERSQRDNSGWLPSAHPSVPSGKALMAGEALMASGVGAQGSQRPPSDQDTAAFLPPCTYADARGCYLQAARGRTPEGELAKPLATTALHAQGNGLSPLLGRPRSEFAQVLNSGQAACQAGREDDLGAGRPRDTPPEAGSGLAPPLPACSTVAVTPPARPPNTSHFP